MRALVTGGGGFVGSRVVQMLLDRGDRVRVLGRHRYPPLEEAGAEGMVGDVRRPNDVEAACAGVEVVFHVAGLAGVWGPRKRFFAINAEGTRNVVRACMRLGVPRLVYTSSPSVVYGEGSIENGDESLPYPPSYLAHYPASKAAAEKIVLEANGSTPETGRGQALWTCALRPHLVWGPGDRHLIPRVVSAARARRLAQVGDGTNKVDVTYIDHAANAHLLAADRLGPGSSVAGKAYFIGDAEPVVLWPWINDLLRRLGLAPVERRVSYRAARRAGMAMEVLHSLLPFLGEPRMTRFVAAQLATSHYFRHQRAERDLGYKPSVDNDTGMERLVAWLERQPGSPRARK